MNSSPPRRALALLVATVIGPLIGPLNAEPAHGLEDARLREYPVGPALSLATLVKEADMIAKVVALSSAPTADAWFTKAQGFAPRETKLMVVTYLKGATRSSEIAFRHYGPVDKRMAFSYMPQHYVIEVGKPYILFAKKTGTKNTYRQLWKHHKMKEDQGLLRAAGHKLHAKKSVKDVFWAELTDLLKSGKEADLTYAISQLDGMSGGKYYNLTNFERERVLRVVQPFIAHANPNVATHAIDVLGSDNPMMAPGSVPFWLGSIGNADAFPGLSRWSLKKRYLAGKLFARELIAVADGGAPIAVRTKAIRAMGLSKHEDARKAALRWVTDAAPEIRQAAILLLSDYPDSLSAVAPTAATGTDGAPVSLPKLAKDPSPLVRVGMAQAIGFGRVASAIPLLTGMLQDAAPTVVKAATQSLLSFPVPQTRDHLRANVSHEEMGVLFVNALSKIDPEPYLDNLCEVVDKGLEPRWWWGGSTPWGVSWDILLRYVQSKTGADLTTEKFTKIFTALERPLRGKRVRYFGSSQPRDLYALYLRRGLPDRAKSYRTLCEKKITYDIGRYFRMVDQNPENYKRR